MNTGLSSANDKNSNTYNFNIDANHDESFSWDSGHKWASVGAATTCPNKSKTAAIFNIVKMLISLHWIEIFAHDIVQRCNT